jgi:glycosyltransferase involved in cell wall biosynthesis
MVKTNEVLFIGLGKSAPCWYRCALPAMNIGADWAGIHMSDDPSIPLLHMVTGLVKQDTIAPNLDDYKVVIIQQPFGRRWHKAIHKMRERGIKVLYEVDDYLHGVRKQRGHDFAGAYDEETLKKYRLCMRAADGMICSTQYIAERYAKFNDRIFVCRNGIDSARYRLTKPTRNTVNIGWAGATGHVEALVDWMNGGVLDVLVGRDNTTFVAVGQPQLAKAIAPVVGESRTLGVPFTLIENYPAAMTMIDIALAPAGQTNWYRGKSDLRWLEAGALGIPLVADPNVYPDIVHGETGFHASSALEAAEIVMELVDNEQLRQQVGEAARGHVIVHRDMSVAARQWLDVIAEITAGD